MSKFPKTFVTVEIPEWGVSPRVSTAVPIAASGTEIKSTRQVSASVNSLLRDEIKKLTENKGTFVKVEVNHLKNLARAKSGTKSGTFFRAIAPASAVVLGRGVTPPDGVFAVKGAGVLAPHPHAKSRKARKRR